MILWCMPHSQTFLRVYGPASRVALRHVTIGPTAIQTYHNSNNSNWSQKLTHDDEIPGFMNIFVGPLIVCR